MANCLSCRNCCKLLGLIVVAISAAICSRVALEPVPSRRQQDAADYDRSVSILKAETRKIVTTSVFDRDQFLTATDTISNLKYPPIERIIASLESDDFETRTVGQDAAASIGTTAVDVIPALIKITERENSDIPSVPSFATREIAAAHSTMGRIGWERSDEVLPVLLRGLKSESQIIRTEAMLGLCSLSLLAKDEIPAIIDYADKYNSQTALMCLASIAPQSPEVLDALLEALSDEKLRPYVIEYLGRVGHFWPSVVVPRLVEIVRDGERFDKERAIESLGRIGPAAEEAIPVLIESLEKFPRASSVALGEIGRRPKLVVPALTRALKFAPNPGEVTYALTKFGPSASDAVPSMISAYEKAAASLDSDDLYRLMHIRPISIIGEPKDRVRAVLLKAMRQDRSPGVRATAATGLGDLSPLDEEVVLALIKALADSDPYPRVAAAASLAKWNQGGERPAQIIAKSLDQYLSDRTSDFNTIRSRIYFTIEKMGELGPKIRLALPSILRAAETGDVWPRSKAIRSAAAMGGNAPEILELLDKALDDGDRYIRFNAALASAEIGIGSADVISILSRELRSGEVEAAEALGRLGSKAKPALPVLIRCRNAPRQRVRDAAVNAILQIKADEK